MSTVRVKYLKSAGLPGATEIFDDVKYLKLAPGWLIFIDDAGHERGVNSSAVLAYEFK